MTDTSFDVVVIGAGAAGLFCAFTAAKRGRKVLVLEKANKPGKKILMSGGGRCNFTNYFIEADHFISQNPHFCKAALKRYTQWDFIQLVESYGIEFEERKHGQLFCVHTAKDILNMLLSECDHYEVEIQTHSELTALKANESSYEVHYQHQGDKKTVCTDAVVVASGALSTPTLGGSDVGYRIAEQFNLPLLPRRAGLVPFMFSDEMKGVCERLTGLSVDAGVNCRGREFRENILFTHRGISGPAILQISNYWYPGDSIVINLLPEQDAASELIQAKKQQGRITVKKWLQQCLPKQCVNELLALFLEDTGDKPLADYPDAQLKYLGEQLNQWQLKPASTEGYRTAEVTLGGVDTNAISSKTMEVNNQKGLYFIGEVLDVTGHLGGFNFQWAWSSAYSAGLVV